MEELSKPSNKKRIILGLAKTAFAVANVVGIGLYVDAATEFMNAPTHPVRGELAQDIRTKADIFFDVLYADVAVTGVLGLAGASVVIATLKNKPETA